MEWTVQELAERAGISGRTLRHYHRVGLLEPDRIGGNGYRYYGPAAVARLQRILLLRETGMPLARIAEALDASATPEAEIEALQAHLGQLAAERAALEQRTRAVDHTLRMRREGREPRMDLMLDGFNDRFEEEVVRRWGRDAFDASNEWWHSKSIAEQRDWKERSEGLLSGWAALHAAGRTPESAAAQHHAAVHFAWFEEIPGTPTHDGDAQRSADMVFGVAATYETDQDFHRAFGSAGAARLAADALRRFVRRERSRGDAVSGPAGG